MNVGRWYRKHNNVCGQKKEDLDYHTYVMLDKYQKTLFADFGLGYIPLDVKHQLAGRIIFPVFDPSENLICVSSRFIHKTDTFLPRYWHESYEKDFHLYGIHLSKHSMRRAGFCDCMCSRRPNSFQSYK